MGIKAKRSLIASAAFVAIISCVFIYLGCAAEAPKGSSQELYKQVELFSDAVTIIQSGYVKEVKPKKLVYGALRGMLSSLDGYSQFMSPESFREMEIDTKGQFGGLGVEIGIRDGVLTVIAPIDGTPAAKAGLKAGDKIVKIDEEVTRDITLLEAVEKLRGKPKTKLELTVVREGEGKLLDFTIVRSIIKLKSIKAAEMIEGNIGYIKLVEFQVNTPKELAGRLAHLTKEGMKALVFDLRNNPGGLLDVSTEVSEKFLEKGKTIVSLKGRMAKQNKTYRSRGTKSFTDFPMVLLVNKGSASASEIVAGAIQDNRRGIILGTKTFGKGSVQTLVPLKDGSALRLTTAAYYTPGGRCIREKGIVPDVEVALELPKKESAGKEDIFENLEKKKEKESPEKKEAVAWDNQLRAAVDMLKGILIYKQEEGAG